MSKYFPFIKDLLSEMGRSGSFDNAYMILSARQHPHPTKEEAAARIMMAVCPSGNSTFSLPFERGTIVQQILLELERAKELHPAWPTDLLHQISVMTEEAGEVVKAGLDSIYKDAPIDDVRTELIQTAAMCLRILINLPQKEGDA